MNENNLPETILMVLGVMMLIKSVWGIAHPLSFIRIRAWWTRAVFQVNTLCGISFIIIGIGVWMAVLLNQPLVNWLVIAFGALLAWVGTVHLKPAELQKLINRILLARSANTVRVCSVFFAILSLLLIWLARRAL